MSPAPDFSARLCPAKAEPIGFDGAAQANSKRLDRPGYKPVKTVIIFCLFAYRIGRKICQKKRQGRSRPTHPFLRGAP
jgi:hypothetical protein